MNRPFAPGDELSNRGRFQFDLRTMLALTALLAWMLGWDAGSCVYTLLILAGMVLIEAGCVPQGNVLKLLVRNLWAFFFVSLAVDTVGFGLMCGANPTGFFGTDHFMDFPFLRGFELRASDEEVFLPHWLRTLPGWWTMLAVGTHWVLNGRARPAAYVLLWLTMAGLILPVFGSWTWGTIVSEPKGWLTQLGHESFGGTSCLVAGWVALAGVLMLGSRRGMPGDRMGILSSTCNRTLVGLGALLLLLNLGPLSAILEFLTTSGQGFPFLQYTQHLMVSLISGLIGAAILCPIMLRRFHWPMVLCGVVAGMLAAEGIPVSLGLESLFAASLAALTASGLVVFASWLMDRCGLDDPGAIVAMFCIGGMTEALGPALLQSSFYSPGNLGNLERLVDVIACVVSFLWAFPLGLLLFWLIKHVPGLALPRAES